MVDVKALPLETSRDTVDVDEVEVRPLMAGGARDLETMRDDAAPGGPCPLETVLDVVGEAPGGLLPLETSRDGNNSVDLASSGLQSVVVPRWRPYPSYRRRWCGIFCNQRSS